jgi:hypothetical protein
VSSAAVTLCVASQRVAPKVSPYFVIDSARKLLDTPSYTVTALHGHDVAKGSYRQCYSKSVRL